MTFEKTAMRHYDSCPMKLLKLIGLSLLLLLLIGLLARNQLIKMEARRLLTEQTGFDLEIGKLKTSLFSSRVELEDVAVRNPPDFPEPTAFVIRRVVVDVDPWALFRKETHLTEMVLDVPRVVVVRNAEGDTNLQRLSGKSGKSDKTGAGGGKPAPAPDKKPPPEPAPERPFKIDRLLLKIGQVEYHDYRGKDGPRVTVVELNIDREKHDVQSASAIGTLLVGSVMESAAVQLFGDVGQSLKTAMEDENLNKEVKKFGKDLKRAFEGMFDSNK